MAEIHVLDNDTIDRIAAGEVIERPVSVVKELVENALDAGADAVTVELVNGGLDLIRVTDNGCGIPADQVDTAFLRHATSKIRTAEDLFALCTLGFRGEALSSIAAVARVELLTRTAEAEAGTRYVIEGGEVRTKEEAGVPLGTSFLVRDLFFNTPVRRKFMKAPQTEASYVITLMEQLCLSRPGISMRLIVNGQTKLQVAGAYRMKDILFTLYGRDTVGKMRPLHYEEKGMRVEGYIGLPVLSRGSRAGELTFVNGRFIKSPLLVKAMEQAYHGLTMQHKFPMAVLQIFMDAEALDVNVHPTKMEVRFRDEKAVFDVVYHAIRETLYRTDLIPEVQAGGEASGQTAASEKSAAAEEKKAFTEENKTFTEEKKKAAEEIKAFPEERKAEAGRKTAEEIKAFPEERKAEAEEKKAAAKALPEGTSENKAKTEEKYVRTEERKAPVLREEVDYRAEADRRLLDSLVRAEESGKRQKAAANEASGTQSIPAADAGVKPEQLGLWEEKILAPAQEKKFRLIGQLFDTYWLMEYEDQFLLCDQHAAHEKVLFERTMKALAARENTSQQLKPPILLSLNGQQAETLERFRAAFERLGYAPESLGGREYSLSAVPDNLFGLPSQQFFTEMLDELGEERVGTDTAMLEAKVAMMSCKAAVKGNQHLSFAEAEALLKELLQLENPYACPHGRPTMIRISRRELEKKFKRIV